MFKQLCRFASLGMGLVVLVTIFYLSSPPATAESPFPPIPLRDNVIVPSQISAVGKKVDTPMLAQAPNGQLMVVFNQWVANDPNDSDPYYSISTTNGQTWTTPQPIAALAGTKSIPAVTYDNDNVAHAVWVETNLAQTQIFYANRQSGGSWSIPLFLAGSAFPTQGVAIVASRLGVVDVLWDIDPGPPGDGRVEHKRFTKIDDTTWSAGPTLVVNDAFSSFGIGPAVAADTNGNLHAVWQTQGTNQVYYSRLNVGEGSWKQPSVLISTDILTGKSFSPDIAIFNNTVYVGISYRETPQQNTNQAVFERHCGNATNTNSCLAPTNWSPIRNISGSFLQVSAIDPFYISPQFMAMAPSQYRQANLFVHYHGFIPGGEGNEIVWRTDACSDWASSFPVQLTASNLRSINPSGRVRAVGAIVTAHTVYEGVSPTTRAILYVSSSSNCGQIYLPFVNK